VPLIAIRMQVVKLSELGYGKKATRHIFVGLIVAFGLLNPHPASGEINFRSRTDYPIGVSPADIVALPGKSGVRLIAPVDDGLVMVRAEYGAWSDPQSIASAAYPKSADVGDFTGDGVTDAVYATRSDKNVAILPSTASGSFERAVRVEVGGLPRFVRTVELGKDHREAVVVVHDDGATLVSRDPEGGFQTSELTTTGAASDLAVVDRNGDDIPDLALAMETEDEIRFQAGDADGGLRPDGAIVTIAGPTRLLAADVNSDGEDDLVVVGQAGLAIHLGRSDRRYYAPRWVFSDAHISAVAVGDIDRDGFVDLGVTNLSRSTVTFFRGMGDGSFQQIQSYMVGRAPTEILLIDVTNDAVVDAIVLNHLADSFTQLTGLGNGVFDSGPCILAQVEDLGEIAAADFNGDSHLDLAITSDLSGSVAVFLGQGRGLFSARAPLPVGRQPRGIVTGHFDPDEHPDLAVANFGTDEVAVLAGDGRGGFDAPILVSVGLGPVAIVTGPFSGPKSADLAVANKLSDSVSILYGDGRGRFPKVDNHPIGISPTFLLVGDTDADGNVDIVVGSDSSESVAILRNNGDAIGEPEANSFGDIARPSVADDFDGDGLIDLVVINRQADAIDILPGIGPGDFGLPIRVPVGRNPSTATTGDFDGDERPDLAVVHPEARTVTILLNRTVSRKRVRRMASAFSDPS